MGTGDGIAPGQWGRGRIWLQRAGAGGEGDTARGHLDPGLAEAREAGCLPPSEWRLKAVGQMGSKGVDRVKEEERDPG